MIGIDFDNTIVCYDEAFRRAAVEQGLAPPDAATSKTAIRDHLRGLGQESRWTELQGEVYGPRMGDARPFPGVGEFFAACRAANIAVAIISHRTRFPYLGPRHDLHAAARDWLARHGFHDADGIGLPVERVFFEETKEAKLARIAAAGCTHFIDDLPELLSDPLFPATVRPILFDPGSLHGGAGIETTSSWALLRSLLVGPAEPLPGGGNNRVYRLETPSGPVLLKHYFRHPADPRERLRAEQAFSRFAWQHGVRSLPQPLACDHAAGIAHYEFIPGHRLTPQEVAGSHVDAAAAFLAALNQHRHTPEAASLPAASEACFSTAEHIACIERRMERVTTIRPESDLHEAALAVVTGRLAPAWHRVRAALAASGVATDDPLPASERIVSPSDFGFHNCLATAAGLKFIDFEYAGWDDPAKTVCDFFCQPAVPVSRRHLERFLAPVAAMLPHGSHLHARVRRLLPAYEIKWCCIMLNEFLPDGNNRRAFAGGDHARVSRQRAQLNKVEAALDRLPD